MNNNIIIPDNILVGYNARKDTYSGKLAYVVFKEGNKIRKEKSWTCWCDKKMGSDEFPNEPTYGFVLNKQIGGVCSYAHSWEQRIEKVRVYDPRGYEFEITIPNLLYVLQECSSIKGKGLEGDFVYGWQGASLVLMPTCSKE